MLPGPCPPGPGTPRQPSPPGPAPPPASGPRLCRCLCSGGQASVCGRSPCVRPRLVAVRSPDNPTGLWGRSWGLSQLCLVGGGEPWPPGVISHPLPPCPGQWAGSSTLSPSGRWGHGEEASGTEEGGPGRAAWPEGGRGPGGPPHPELELGRTLGAPEGAACWPASQKRESPPLHLDFLPRVGGRPWGSGCSQKAPP